MKLLRYGPPGEEKPGVLDGDGKIRDLSGIIPDLAGESLFPESIEKLRNNDISLLPKVAGQPRIGPCVGSVGKFVCIGLNYSDHAAEAGMAVPAEPVIFMKATSSICGPNDNVVVPRGSKKTDWEVELGVVIGKLAKYVDCSLGEQTQKVVADEPTFLYTMIAAPRFSLISTCSPRCNRSLPETVVGVFASRFVIS
jgi:2-keto-4-pentenoate hydratase/2-oxohepta-3-ene-1,7-dioic acid hydratase in catechol pathway